MSLLARLALILSLTLAATPALAQKAYVRPDLAGDGQRLEERLKREVGASQRPFATLLRDGNAALSRGDARSALPLANAAAMTDPANPAGWRLMAQAAIGIEPRDYRERYELRERAISAAYLAYQRSTSRPSASTVRGGPSWFRSTSTGFPDQPRISISGATYPAAAGSSLAFTM